MRNLNYGHWIGLLASLIGIATPLLPIIQKSRYDLVFPWSIVFVVVLFILWENRYLKLNWRRKKRYMEELGAINQAHAHLRHLAGVSRMDKAQIKITFEQSLSQLTEVFSRLTGTICSASIKVLIQDFRVYGFEAHIATFARDYRSLSTRGNPVYQSPMTLEENTDFKLIVQNLKAGNPVCHFLSNDLLKDALKGYRNSRFGKEFYNTAQTHTGARGYSLLNEIWTLEYRSAIVVPIYPLQAEKEHDLVGFLCIDSPKTEAFLPCDVDILKGLAAVMFEHKDLIKAYYDDFRDQPVNGMPGVLHHLPMA